MCHFFVLITVFVMRMASFGTIFAPVAIFIMREDILQWKGRDTTSHADLQAVSPLTHPGGRTGWGGGTGRALSPSCDEFSVVIFVILM